MAAQDSGTSIGVDQRSIKVLACFTGYSGDDHDQNTPVERHVDNQGDESRLPANLSPYRDREGRGGLGEPHRQRSVS